MKHELFGMTPNTRFSIDSYDSFGRIDAIVADSDESGILIFEISDNANMVTLCVHTTDVPEPEGNTIDRLFIYNVKGQEVFSCDFDYDSYTRFVWDGKNNRGESVGKGIYFLRYGKIKKKLFRL